METSTLAIRPIDGPSPTSSTTNENSHQRSDTAIPLNELRKRNRRKRYLELHPEYFMSPDLELADPLLYDRLIRRFQTAAERETEGRKKGYSGILEADLLRSEAKVEALAHPDPSLPFTYRRGSQGEILAEEKEDIPTTKAEGRDRWEEQMRWRFLKGDDDDFNYSSVDHSEELDDLVQERRDEQDRYFDTEEPGWVVGERVASSTPPALQGQTGVQDF